MNDVSKDHDYIIFAAQTTTPFRNERPMTPERAPTSTELAGQRTNLADDRTSLAVSRTMLAQDRTLMAWVRTSMSLISFGFTIYKFFQFLESDSKTPHVEHLLSPRGVGLVMISLGVGGLLLATFEHRKQMMALRERYKAYGPFHTSVASAIAAIVLGLGVLGFILVFLRQ
jgi:putative membrane protein